MKRPPRPKVDEVERLPEPFKARVLQALIEQPDKRAGVQKILADGNRKKLGAYCPFELLYEVWERFEEMTVFVPLWHAMNENPQRLAEFFEVMGKATADMDATVSQCATAVSKNIKRRQKRKIEAKAAEN